MRGWFETDFPLHKMTSGVLFAVIKALSLMAGAFSSQTRRPTDLNPSKELTVVRRRQTAGSGSCVQSETMLNPQTAAGMPVVTRRAMVFDRGAAIARL